MGCDIAMTVECRVFCPQTLLAWCRLALLRCGQEVPEWVDDDEAMVGTWIYVGEGWDDRDYGLFGLLAGVRSDSYAPIEPPRGIPDDATEETMDRLAMGDPSDHTPSFLTAAEILRAEVWEYVDHPFVTWVEGQVARCKSLPFHSGRPEDVRFVFCFYS